MFAMNQNRMDTFADAWYAPACQSARQSANTMILDTAVEAVSVLILGILSLLGIIVRIIIPHQQS